MNVTILAVGTLGSVQPFVALGLELTAAGHQVTIATSTNLEGFVRESGLPRCVAVVGDTRRWTDWLSRGRSREKPTVLIPTLARKPQRLEGMLEEFFAKSLAAGADADLIISSATGYCVGQPVADKLGVPHCSAFVQPFHRTREFPQLFWPQLPEWVHFGRGSYNWATHAVTMTAIGTVFGRSLSRARRRALGTGGHRYRQDALVLYGYSPAWIPKPRDWSDNIHVTGYWFLNRDLDWQPSADLVDFLATGPPPVYVGLGSLASVRPQIMDMAVAALRRTGQRGIIASGWSTWEAAGAGHDILVTKELPHEWLFPRVSAVVHHAGTGTVGAGLRAGRPSVTIPVMYDHFFFAHHVFQRGLGPCPLKLGTTTTEQLSDAIAAVTGDEAMRRRASELGTKIRQEDGARRAVDLINAYVPVRG